VNTFIIAEQRKIVILDGRLVYTESRSTFRNFSQIHSPGSHQSGPAGRIQKLIKFSLSSIWAWLSSIVINVYAY